MTHRRVHLAVVVLALVAAGCRDPYSQPDRRAPTADAARPREHRDPADAERATRTFATRWINWDWRQAGAQQRALARLASRQLAADLNANARSARIDATLARDKPSSRGTVIGVDLPAAGATRSGVVATREQTYTAGQPDLGGQHHRVYRIRLTASHGRWEVSTWQRLP
jgi:hypothetical protein